MLSETSCSIPSEFEEARNSITQTSILWSDEVSWKLVRKEIDQWDQWSEEWRTRFRQR